MMCQGVNMEGLEAYHREAGIAIALLHPLRRL
mgnify:CR=1 FL=1